MDSYGLDNCGYCWAVAEDGIIQHHKNCKLANLQALADKRLEELRQIKILIDNWSSSEADLIATINTLVSKDIERTVNMDFHVDTQEIA